MPPLTKANNIVVGGTWIDSFGTLNIGSDESGCKAEIDFTQCGWLGQGRYQMEGYIYDKDRTKRIKARGTGWNGGGLAGSSLPWRRVVRGGLPPSGAPQAERTAPLACPHADVSLPACLPACCRSGAGGTPTSSASGATPMATRCRGRRCSGSGPAGTSRRGTSTASRTTHTSSTRPMASTRCPRTRGAGPTSWRCCGRTMGQHSGPSTREAPLALPCSLAPLPFLLLLLLLLLVLLSCGAAPAPHYRRLEERQRAERRERVNRGDLWEPRFFRKVSEGLKVYEGERPLDRLPAWIWKPENAYRPRAFNDPAAATAPAAPAPVEFSPWQYPDLHVEEEVQGPAAEGAAAAGGKEEEEVPVFEEEGSDSRQ